MAAPKGIFVKHGDDFIPISLLEALPLETDRDVVVFMGAGSPANPLTSNDLQVIADYVGQSLPENYNLILISPGLRSLHVIYTDGISNDRAMIISTEPGHKEEMEQSLRELGNPKLRLGENVIVREGFIDTSTQKV